MSDNDSSNRSIRIEAADPEGGWPNATPAGVSAATPLATEQTGQAITSATSATSAISVIPPTSIDGAAGDETEELREEIEETRAELSATLDAIQERLNPQHLVEQAKEAAQETTEHLVEQAKHAAHEATVDFVEGAKDTVREATIGKVEHMVSNVTDTAKDVMGSVTDTAKDVVDSVAGTHMGPHSDTAGVGALPTATANTYDTPQGAGSTLWETIKENPIPTALAAASLGWLFAHRANSTATRETPRQTASASYASYPSSSPQPYASYPSSSPQPYASYQQPAYREQDTVRVTGDATGATRNTVDQVQGMAGQVVDQVQDTVGQVQDKAGQVADQVQGTVGATINQVQDKAGQVAGQAQQTAGGFLHGAEQMVKANPIPAALAAASLGWLFAHRPQGSSTTQTSYPSYQGPYQGRDTGRDAYGASGATQNKAGQVVDQVQDKAGKVADQAQQAAGGLLHGTQDAVGGLVQGTQDTVGGLAQGAQDTVGGLAQGTQQTARQAQGQFQRLLQENPLAAGAAAVAVGTAIGLIIPETQRETQLMGGARDTVVDRAMGTAQDTMHKVGAVAQKAESAAESALKDEAHAQGLVSS